MHCTLLIADALPPGAADAASGLRLPALESALARSESVRQAPLEREAWLCQAFGIAQQHDWPLAPLMAAADGIAVGASYWLLAQPVHLAIERADPRLIADAAADLSLPEAQQLIAALNAHFAPDGIEFYAANAARWYVRASAPQVLCTTPAGGLADVEIKAHLPRGQDARRWKRILNEAQMVLHAHPVNAAREARRALAINSPWFWGGGTLPAPAQARYQNLWSDDELAHALALASGAARSQLPQNAQAWLAQASGKAQHLLVLDAPAAARRAGDPAAWAESLSQIERSWIAPLIAALRAGRIESLDFALANEGGLLQAHLTRSNLGRWWRRRQALTTYARTA